MTHVQQLKFNLQEYKYLQKYLLQKDSIGYKKCKAHGILLK